MALPSVYFFHSLIPATHFHPPPPMILHMHDILQMHPGTFSSQCFAQRNAVQCRHITRSDFDLNFSIVGYFHVEDHYRRRNCTCLHPGELNSTPLFQDPNMTRMRTCASNPDTPNSTRFFHFRGFLNFRSCHMHHLQLAKQILR